MRSVYHINRREVELGAKDSPYAWVIPAGQHDPPVAARLVQILDELGVEVHRALAPFEAGGKSYPAGSYVVLMAQPFRAFAKDLLEKQNYPLPRTTPDGPFERPYDLTGWTLPYQMGVDAVEVDKRFEARLERLESIPIPRGRFDARTETVVGYEICHNTNNASIATNRLLKAGKEVAWEPDGTIFVREKQGAELEQWTRQLGIDVKAVATAPANLRKLRQPRLALYRPWSGSRRMDEGWTRWLLEQYEFPYTTVRSGDIKAAKLLDRFDAIVLADQPKQGLLRGVENEWLVRSTAAAWARRASLRLRSSCAQEAR